MGVARHASALLDPSDMDHFVRLHDVSWADYERLLRIRGDRSAPRIAYLEGEVEIISPSRSHEVIKSFIGRLVEVYCDVNDIEFTPVGSWTLKQRPKKRGAEPDECYVFGDYRNAARPQLAIEVEWTHGRIDKLEIYRKLAVREVWYWHDDRIQPYVLRGERYRLSATAKRCLASTSMKSRSLCSGPPQARRFENIGRDCFAEDSQRLALAVVPSCIEALTANIA